MITQAPPVLVVHAVRNVKSVSFSGRLDLDPHRKCVLEYTAADYAVEPDLSEDGMDTCGSPKTATVVIRVVSDSTATIVRERVKLVKERGRFRFSVPTNGRSRWSMTLLNPIGRNVTVTGRTR